MLWPRFRQAAGVAIPGVPVAVSRHNDENRGGSRNVWPDMKQVPANQLGARALIAAIVLGTMGALTIMIVPGFVMLVGAQSALDDRQLGFVAAWDINAAALAIGVATF